VAGSEFLAALSAIIWGLSWTNVLILCAFAFFGWRLYKMQTGTSRFDIDDLFLDHRTNRADLSKLVIAVFAALSIWAIVTLMNRDKVSEVVTLLPIVLGIFVVGRAAKDWGNRGTPETEQNDPPVVK
jgi:hypothetical protein